MEKFRSYRRKVDSVSRVQVKRYDVEIPEGYQIDHIFPVSYGRSLNIPPHIIGHIENIQIIKGFDNLQKSNKVDSIPLFIQQYILGITKERLDEEYEDNKKIGIRLAKEKGIYKGRKPGASESKETFLSKPKIKEVVRLLGEGMKAKHISDDIGVHVNTITKVKKYLSE